MNVNNNLQIVLASKSPRRREILSRLGYSFAVITADTDETLNENVSVEERVRILAERKARAVLPMCDENALIIGSDTLLEFEGEPLGKPTDELDAKRMLLSLSGKAHRVHTSLALLYRGKAMVSSDVTTVNMRNYTEKEVTDYVYPGDPMDKAGSYGIQSLGGFLVESIEGELDTVVGFPSRLFGEMITEILK